MLQGALRACGTTPPPPPPCGRQIVSVSLPYSPCPSCRRPINSNPDRSPDTILTEKVENYPRFGPDNKPIWMRVGYAHKARLAGRRDYRPVAESRESTGTAPPAAFRPR